MHTYMRRAEENNPMTGGVQLPEKDSRSVEEIMTEYRKTLP